MKNEHDELWLRFLSGQALSPEEEKGLLGALQADPELRERLMSDVEMNGLLRELGIADREGESFAQAVTDYLSAKGDETSFLKRVQTRMQDQGLINTPGKGTRRPPTRRSTSRRPGSWLPILIAAGVLLTLIWVVYPSGPSTAPRNAATRKAETLRKESERRITEIDQEKERLGQLEREATARQEAEAAQKARKAKEALEAERARLEREMKLAVGPAPKPAPEPEKPPVVQKPAPPPQELPKPEAPTQVVLAAAETVEGDVTLVASTGRVALKAGDNLAAGHGVVIGAGRLVMVYPDKTRVEFGAETVVEKLEARPGKWLSVLRGVVLAVVAKQPKDQAMVFATPQGEAIVVGTTLKLLIDATSTRLEVTEGKVRLRNLAGKTVDVSADQYAVAAVGTELVSKIVVPDTAVAKLVAERGQITISFGPDKRAVPEGVLIDSGEEFDAKRGYGWLGPKVGPEIPGAYSIESDGSRFIPRKGRKAGTRGGPDLRASQLGVGWSNHVETWKMPLANGRYHITVCAGDGGFEQGPHHVSVEGFQLIDAVITRQGFVEQSVILEIKDRELTMAVGGCGAGKVSKDNSSDTTLNYIVIQKLPGRK